MAVLLNWPTELRNKFVSDCGRKPQWTFLQLVEGKSRSGGMQRGDLGFIVSRLMSVLLVIQAFQYTLGLALIAGTMGKYQMSGELAVQVAFCVAQYALAAFLWFRAELFAGGTTRAKISIENPVTFQRILFGAVGLYFLVAGVANLMDSLWWEVIAKSQFSSIFHQPTSHVVDIARTVIGFVLLLLNGSKLGSR